MTKHEPGRDARKKLRITPRELEVLSGVLRGDGNKQIACDLGVTEQAIKDHVSSLLDKFHVRNRAALAEAGVRLEFSGEPGVDRSWMRELFLRAKPQVAIARGPEIRYEAANEAFLEAAGHRPIVGRTMREAFPEYDGRGIFEKVERVYATGLPLVEHEAVWLSGPCGGVETRRFDLHVQPLHDDDGNVNGIISSAVDVTDLVEERRRAELVRDELSAVLDEVPSGVIFVDENGRLVKMNAAARRITRNPVDPQVTLNQETLARFRIRYGDGSEPVLADMPLARALRGESSPPQTYIFEIGDPPEPVHVRSSSRTLRDPDGRIRGAVIVVTECLAEPLLVDAAAPKDEREMGALVAEQG
ncbi:MAG TPA: PAS domain-containing protein [Candidatus Acidoferrales bacterium]|nr:PAS domain-containing protein [Candidatus Acidoferrales bacterium]